MAKRPSAMPRNRHPRRAWYGRSGPHAAAKQSSRAAYNPQGHSCSNPSPGRKLGIANLLAAEAQRLMRGAHAACASDGLAVGQSVRQTLEAIIDLEHVLLEKLELTLGECMLHP